MVDRSTTPNGPVPATRPTILTVAERAGVSKSLVSLVLSRSPKVSPDRRAAVERAIRELGYRPNIAARDLRQRRSRTVGVLLNDVRHPWFVDLLDGLTDGLAEQGRQLLLSSGRLDRGRDESVPHTFADLGVVGMVLVGTQAGSPTLTEVAQAVPTVAVGWRALARPRGAPVAHADLPGGLGGPRRGRSRPGVRGLPPPPRGAGPRREHRSRTGPHAAPDADRTDR